MRRLLALSLLPVSLLLAGCGSQPLDKSAVAHLNDANAALTQTLQRAAPRLRDCPRADVAKLKACVDRELKRSQQASQQALVAYDQAIAAARTTRCRSALHDYRQGIAALVARLRRGRELLAQGRFAALSQLFAAQGATSPGSARPLASACRLRID